MTSLWRRGHKVGAPATYLESLAAMIRSSNCSHFFSAVVAGMLLAATCSSALAQSQLVAPLTEAPSVPTLKGYASNVDHATRDILRSEVDLEKYSLSYRMNAARQGRWKAWRYFAFQEADLMLLEANTVALVSYRGAHLNSPSGLRRGPTAAATALPFFIGFVTGATGDGVELGVNSLHAWQARRAGFSQSRSQRHVVELLANIDRKLAQRQEAVAQESVGEPYLQQLHALEGKLLADFRNLSIAEFERFHTGTSRNLTTENAFYALDLIKQSTGAVWTGMVMYLINHDRGRMDVSAGILDMTNAGLTVLDPVLAHAAGSSAAALDRRALHRAGLSMLTLSEGDLLKDYEQFQSFLQAHQNSESAEIVAALNRLEHYAAEVSYFTRQINDSAAELRATRQAALGHLGWGLFVGGSKLPLAILPTIGGVRFPYRQGVVNCYYFAGGVAFLPAVTLTIIDSWKKRIEGELTYQRLRRDGKLPGQLLHTRLLELQKFAAKLE